MNDSELLKHLLGNLSITDSGDLDWPYSDLVKGLIDAGESPEIVHALIKRKLEFNKMT